MVSVPLGVISLSTKSLVGRTLFFLMAKKTMQLDFLHHSTSSLFSLYVTTFPKKIIVQGCFSCDNLESIFSCSSSGCHFVII